MHDLLIINPRSNNGKALQLFERAKTACDKQLQKQIDQTKKITLSPNKQIIKLKELTQAKRIFLLGGDGSLNSLINALFKRKLLAQVKIAHLPGGFGNGVSAMLHYPNLKESLALFQPASLAVKADLIQTNIKSSPIGLFCAGLGYDAEVVKLRQKYLRFKAFSYPIAAVEAVFRPRHTQFILQMSKASMATTLKLHCSQIMIGNGPYYGLIKAIPQAKWNDGRLDFRAFSALYKFALNSQPRNVHWFSTGNLSSLDFSFEEIYLRPESSSPYSVQIDGDPYEHRGVLKINVLKNAVNYLVLNKKTIITPKQ